MNISFTNSLPAHHSVICLPASAEKIVASQNDALVQTLKPAFENFVKNTGFEGKIGQHMTLVHDNKPVIVYGTGPEEQHSDIKIRHIGAHLMVQLKKLKGQDVVIFPFSSEKYSQEEVAANLRYGLTLRGYSFDKYITDEKALQKIFLPQTVSFVVSDPQKAETAYEERAHMHTAVKNVCDLMSEPGNVLHPMAFCQHIEQLREVGVKVTILDQQKLEELGAGGILAIGQGSTYPSAIAIMEWNGAEANQKPVALVGKGVTFDTGGINLKPGARMDEMKKDMTGAAVVTETLRLLALRKAKTNVVGLVGLTENAIDGNASRPGDIIKTYSGKTIELIDLDAEGRVVLSDVLWYAQKHYDPEIIIDLATLTGAVMVALEHEYTGLFSNDDTLSKQLLEAGDTVQEKLWRLPMCEKFDRMMDSTIADVRNLGKKRWASSSTAAHFLERFVNGKKWAHLDIAGSAMLDQPHVLTGHVFFGCGVELLNTLIKNNYEGK